MYREKIDKFIDAHKTEMLEDIAELCKIDSTKDSYRQEGPTETAALRLWAQRSTLQNATDFPSTTTTTMWERWI